jgi:putative spermidine/putrescine transport system ATP-binding protein
MSAERERRGLVVDQLTRGFGSQRAADQISFVVAPGELVALVGASGSGKTTTLRMVAGYEHPDSGRVLFDGADLTRVPPAKRDFGMVFQHYALFPHMSVVDNVAFGLEARGVSRAERRRRAQQALDGVGLESKGARMVQQLSGGEQQRVALARAVVIEPRLLLLDEPLSNLDPTLRQSTRDELRAALRNAGAPALFVTHDQDDAFAVADRIVLLAHGRVLQVGGPEELYARPASREVAAFIGHATLLDAHATGDRARVAIDGVVRDLVIQRGTGVPDAAEMNGAVVLRPETLTLDATRGEQGWDGVVTARRFAGASFVYHVKIAEGAVVQVASPHRVEEGENVSVRVDGVVPFVP